MHKKLHGKRSFLEYQFNKNRLTTNDVMKLLGISAPTMYRLLNNPQLFTLGQLRTICGSIGVQIEVAIYCLDRLTGKVDSRSPKESKWYITGIREKGEAYIGEYRDAVK